MDNLVLILLAVAVFTLLLLISSQGQMDEVVLAFLWIFVPPTAALAVITAVRSWRRDRLVVIERRPPPRLPTPQRRLPPEISRGQTLYGQTMPSADDPLLPGQWSDSDDDYNPDTRVTEVRTKHSPTRAPSLESDYFLPLAIALTVGGILALLWWVIAGIWWANTNPWTRINGGWIFGIGWLFPLLAVLYQFLFNRKEDLINAVEDWTKWDVNGDGHIGQPTPPQTAPPIYTVELVDRDADGVAQMGYADLPAGITTAMLEDVCHGFLYEHKRLGRAEWTEEPHPILTQAQHKALMRWLDYHSFTQLRDLLRPQQGREVTPEGFRFFQSVAKQRTRVG